MAKLLRRVWKSVTICPYSQSNADLESDSVDPAEKLPQDVFRLILKRLGARDSARAALVCRAWWSVVADEKLWHFFLREEAGNTWEAVLFAETYLRSGFPVRSVVTDVYGTLPFRLIYSQQKQLQGSIIIDGGSGYCKYGWSKDSRPSGRQTMGLHRAVELCVEHCNTSEVGKVADEGWFKTIVLAGGSACLPGLAERLEKELHQALPSTVAKGLKVFSPPYGSESAWFGAKIISNMSTYPEVWCIRKKQFRRYGVSAIHAMTLDEK